MTNTNIILQLHITSLYGEIVDLVLEETIEVPQGMVIRSYKTTMITLNGNGSSRFTPLFTTYDEKLAKGMINIIAENIKKYDCIIK